MRDLLVALGVCKAPKRYGRRSGNPMQRRMEQRAQKLAVIRSEHTLVVGVDVAKHNHWSGIVDGRSELPVGSAFKFQNSREGFSRLLQQIAKAQEKTGATRVVVGMEPTGHYWRALAWYLQEAKLTVVLVNPYSVKTSKEHDDNSPTKSDRKDAWVIARLVLEGKFFPAHLPAGVWAELRGLTQARRQQRRKLNTAVNQLQALLDEYFPEYSEVFDDPLGQASLYVLQHRPFPSDVLAVRVEELAAELRAASNRRVGFKRAQNLQEAARRSIGVPFGLQAARLRIGQILREVAFSKDRLEETEAAMAEALKKTGLAPYLLSVPGVGVVTAAWFLGEVGDLRRYEDWRQVRKLAGYDLTENTSGQRSRSKTPISKRGRPGLRQVLYQMAMTAATRNPQFRVLYRHLRTRQQNPLPGKQALVALACKLLRVLFTLAREQRTYDPARALGAWRTQQLGLAA